MQIMLTGGLGAAALLFVLFALVWVLETRQNGRTKMTAGTMFNAAGFGLFPALAAWKVFEPYCGVKMPAGRKLFDPVSPIPFLTRDGRFAPDRIELAAILLAFIAVVIWLILRREPLPGNGDLFLSVICIWSAVRTTTETLREYPVRFDSEGVSVFMTCAVAAEIIVMAVWTVRRGRKQKNIVMTLLEWLAVVACGVICILQDARVLSMGSSIANLVIAAGCSVLAAALILSAGKDSRETV